MKHKWIIIPALIIAGAIYALHFNKKMDVPVQLLGKWTTSAPGYQDRFIELTKKTMVYGIGEGEKDVYMITGLKENIEGKNTIYTINYKSPNVKYSRSFYYQPKNGGTIQFKHQEHIVWRKNKKNTTS